MFISPVYIGRISNPAQDEDAVSLLVDVVSEAGPASWGYSSGPADLASLLTSLALLPPDSLTGGGEVDLPGLVTTILTSLPTSHPAPAPAPSSVTLPAPSPALVGSVVQLTGTGRGGEVWLPAWNWDRIEQVLAPPFTTDTEQLLAHCRYAANSVLC